MKQIKFTCSIFLLMFVHTAVQPLNALEPKKLQLIKHAATISKTKFETRKQDMIKEPYYMLDFTAGTCMFEIRVNDNPIMTMDIKGGVSTSIPINNGIAKTGPLEISIKLLPNEGEVFLSEGCYFNYSVVLVDVANGKFEHKDQFGYYRSTRLRKGEQKNIIPHTAMHSAEVPYQMKALWENGKDISKVKNAEEHLRDAYDRVANGIKNKQFDAYQKLIASREYNMKVCMYLSEQESKARFEGLKKDLEGGYDIVQFPQNTVMIISGYGKKASLKRLNGDPALSFGNKEEQEQIMLDLEFYWSKETKQFEII